MHLFSSRSSDPLFQPSGLYITPVRTFSTGQAPGHEQMGARSPRTETTKTNPTPPPHPPGPVTRRRRPRIRDLPIAHYSRPLELFTSAPRTLVIARFAANLKIARTTSRRSIYGRGDFVGNAAVAIMGFSATAWLAWTTAPPRPPLTNWTGNSHGAPTEARTSPPPAFERVT